MATNTNSGSSAKDQDKKQEAKQKANEVKAEAKQQAGEAADQAKQKAGELAEQAKQQATSQIATQKERASSSLSSISKALHDASGTLRDEDQGAVAGYVDDAAGQLEQFADILQNRSVGELLDEAKRYARREPALFLGGAMVIGLFGARFLKSSSPESSRYGRRESRPYGSGRQGSYRGSPSERRSRIYTPSEGAQGTTTVGSAGLVTPGSTSAKERSEEEGKRNG
ncbi:MAG: ATP synthase F0 subunit B [Rhodothermales bacterium]